MQVKKQQLELDMEQQTVFHVLFGHVQQQVPNRKRSTSRLYIVTCLFNLYAECIMRNAGLDEAQAGIKIARRNINLIYADDTTVMAESNEELKEPL